jgi:hypothetical protein
MKNSESANQGTMLLHHFLVTLLLWSQGHHNHQKGLLVSITLSCHFIALESRPLQPPEGFYWYQSHFLVTLLLWSQGHHSHQKVFTGINHTFLSLYCFGVKAITATRRVLLVDVDVYHQDL